MQTLHSFLLATNLPKIKTCAQFFKEFTSIHGNLILFAPSYRRVFQTLHSFLLATNLPEIKTCAQLYKQFTNLSGNPSYPLRGRHFSSFFWAARKCVQRYEKLLSTNYLLFWLFGQVHLSLEFKKF